MNINYKQPQFELFPAQSAALEDINKPRFMLANLTLSVENLVILSILGIMVGLFSFSVGVERGKQIAAHALDERINAVWNLSGRRPGEPIKPFLASSASQVKGNAGYVAYAGKTAAVAVPVKPAAVKPVTSLKANAQTRTAKVAAPAKLVPASGNITVQVATYKVEGYAQKEALDLRSKGYQTFLIKKGDFWLVCAGRFASLEAANNYLKKLQVRYRGSQLRRI